MANKKLCETAFTIAGAFLLMGIAWLLGGKNTVMYLTSFGVAFAELLMGISYLIREKRESGKVVVRSSEEK
ncbi:hypothetical protein [Butyrivibrio sp. INlla16]|uniref:hypothetical protein n=1 Tax=Butyrivibrio sp. INlla16 TaxID=1520807 RepID=UPI000890AB2C|nr:hypothetical protein [Butyrivibrio sp. INlla16]SDB62711.1 hypothetical protein SAMN02910263_03401 [Butyrivibrio sp. INlla16]